MLNYRGRIEAVLFQRGRRLSMYMVVEHFKNNDASPPERRGLPIELGGYSLERCGAIWSLRRRRQKAFSPALPCFARRDRRSAIAAARSGCATSLNVRAVDGESSPGNLCPCFGNQESSQTRNILRTHPLRRIRLRHSPPIGLRIHSAGENCIGCNARIFVLERSSPD
jgi:hypothetical protein